MAACERAIIEAGFRTVDIVATLAVGPLYASFGYEVVERYEIAYAARFEFACGSSDQERGEWSMTMWL